MKLSSDDLALFFRLQASLMLYANQQLKVLPRVRDEAALEQISMEDRVRLRNALYDRSELIGQFVTANPAGLSADELAIVASWQHFVRGEFYVVRFLKRHAVFLTAESPPRAYGVVGLTQEIEEVLFAFRPPIYLATVLLPFKGRIVYDGLVETSNILFGSGIRSSLNEEYQAIRERGEIIESLEPGDVASPAGAPRQRVRRAAKARQSPDETLAILERMAADAESLRGADAPATQRAFALVRAAIQLAQTAVATPTAADEWTRSYRRARTALTQLHTSLSRTVWRGE